MQALSSTETSFALEWKQIRDWRQWNNNERDFFSFLFSFYAPFFYEGASAEEREKRKGKISTRSRLIVYLKGVNFVAIFSPFIQNFLVSKLVF